MNAVIDKHNRVHRCGIRWPKNSSGLNQCTDCKLIRRVSPLICICTNPTAATLVFVPFIWSRNAAKWLLAPNISDKRKTLLWLWQTGNFHVPDFGGSNKWRAIAFCEINFCECRTTHLIHSILFSCIHLLLIVQPSRVYLYLLNSIDGRGKPPFHITIAHVQRDTPFGWTNSEALRILMRFVVECERYLPFTRL